MEGSETTPGGSFAILTLSVWGSLPGLGELRQEQSRAICSREKQPLMAECLPPPNSQVGVLPPNGMEVGGGVFAR